MKPPTMLTVLTLINYVKERLTALTHYGTPCIPHKTAQNIIHNNIIFIKFITRSLDSLH